MERKSDTMGHLDHLAAVAQADVAHVLEREATYKGSWKRSGGLSAWFMLKRKIDRLLVMMARPEAPTHFNLTNVNDTIAALARGNRLPGSDPATADILSHIRDCYTAEDVFLKIEEDPSGQDGTPLAEMRDLRQYLLLVEAEMVNRGVVQRPTSGVVSSSSLTGAELAQLQVPGGPYMVLDIDAPEEVDPYQRIATLTGLEKIAVENAVAKLIAEQLHELWVKDPEPEDLYDGVSKQSGIPRETLKNAMLTLGAVPNPPRPVRLVEDGVDHISDQTPGFAYIRVRDPVTDSNYYNVDRRTLPPDSCDYLRKLRLELNHKEYTDTLPEYRGMYGWKSAQNKWVLAEAWQQHWGKET